MDNSQAGAAVSKNTGFFWFSMLLAATSWFDSEIENMDLKHIKQLYFENATGTVAQLNSLVSKTESAVVKAVKDAKKECEFSLIFDNEPQVAPYLKKVDSLGFEIKEQRSSHCPDGYYVTFIISGWVE